MRVSIGPPSMPAPVIDNNGEGPVFVMCPVKKKKCYLHECVSGRCLDAPVVVAPHKFSEVAGVALESSKKAEESSFSRKCPVNGIECYNAGCEMCCAGISVLVPIKTVSATMNGGDVVSVSDKGVVYGVGPNAPIETNAKGAKQSALPYRCDCLPPVSLLHIAKILKGGVDKYGKDNWRNIVVLDHINHAMTHILAYLANDQSDDHLGHATCRMLMALEISLTETFYDKPYRD